MRLFLFGTALFLALPSQASRVKELVKIEGLRANHLVGYGLVVGLDGQGDNDSARFTVKSIAALMQRQGVQVKEREIRVKNVAAVMVTSQLPPFPHSALGTPTAPDPRAFRPSKALLF